ncbi:uncharacterized protein RJT21DRAFT_17129 [Scheffersomyces amazonensis]|uniref:uncharacterized protein n=1 Tax=Scheffersomyces amazonensis TaxID=1078765 RepID=UPI00315C551F
MVSLPNPPVLKTTIIQLNKELDSDDNNYEILTNEYLNGSNNKSDSTTPRDVGDIVSPNNGLDIISTTATSPSLGAVPNKKKRRRSSANIDSEELAKRKHETKQLHSIIEKRRRIKINREFEALKYLIPACRTSTGSSSNPSTPNITAINSKKTPPPSNNNNNNNNNGNKIDGMYKLTILKSSVEYILYLHHIIQKQHELLINATNENIETNGNNSVLENYKNFSIDFAKIPLNVNQYRNIDKDFSFKDLLTDYENGTTISPTSNNTTKRNYDFRTHVIKEEDENEGEDDNQNGNEDEDDEDNYSTISKDQLPSPDITPNMAPILTLLNKYSGTSNNGSSNIRKSSYPGSPNTLAINSANASPFSHPLKSSFSSIPLTKASSSSPPMRFQRSSLSNNSNNSNSNKFSLPDPAINPNSQLSELPKKKFFKSKIPNAVIFNGNGNRNGNDEDEDEKDIDEIDERLSDQDASKTLLALRKSSIDSLLN